MFASDPKARADLKLGSREDFRYWFIRGEFGITMETTPMSIGPVGIFGFIGGAYQHMEATEIRNEAGAVVDVRYTPTAENTFGIMAGVHIGVNGKPSSFHAKIVLTARFRNERLSEIALDGRGWFMCDLERECNGADDSWAQLHIGFDFDNNRFLATLAANISLRPLIVVSAPPGSIEILFEPGNWHIYVGRGGFDSPERRTISATFFPDIANVMAQLYIMAGDHIAVDIGGIRLTGGGFATGIDVSLRAGGQFLIFYGELWGNLRAEIAIINVDEIGSYCLQGANGWYALANFRLGLGLAVGIDVDLWFVSGRFEIFRAEIGVDLLIGGPGPTFVDGDARGSFSILNGLISGSFHYHMHVGDEVPRECLTAAIDGQFRMPEPIVSVAPAENANNVSVFTTIGLGFALREKGELEMRRRGERVRARFRLHQPLEVVAADGSRVNGSLRIAGDSLSAEWSTEDVLLPQTRYTITAIAIAEEYNGSRWIETKRQVKTWSFTTGERPRDIYDGNIVAYTYPLIRQRYSYVEGHEGKHYVQVKRNMDYLFTNMPPSQTLIAEYTDQNRVKQEAPARYEPFRTGCGGTIVIDDPPVTTGTKYHLRIIKRTDRDYGKTKFSDPRAGLTRINLSNYKRMSASNLARIKQLELSGTDVASTTRESEYFRTERREGSAEARVLRNGRYTDSVMYDWFFGVGRYGTPQEKFNAATASYTVRLGSFIGFRVTSPEPIDDDLSGMALLRNPITVDKNELRTNGSVESWKSSLSENDKLARDYGKLVSLVGATDAAKLRSHVLTSDSRLRYPLMTYVDVKPEWSFSPSNHTYYQLRPDELRFEERTPTTGFTLAGMTLGLIGSGIGGSGTGGIGAGIGFAGTIGGSSGGYVEEVVINPLNASQDLTALTWRYRNAPYAWVPEGPLGFPIPLASLLSPTTVEALRRVGERRLVQTPSGRFDLMMIAKTRNWRTQTMWESGFAGGYVGRQDALRLEQISSTGRTTGIDFGEISCGSVGTIPSSTIRLQVP